MKTNFGYLAIILSFCSFSVRTASAVPPPRSIQAVHEFSIYGGGGLSSFRYQLSPGNVSSSYGGDFGVGYTCIFLEHWGIHTGIGLGLYGAKAVLDNVEIVTPNLTDSDGDRFDLHVALTDYNETQKAICLNIPLMVHFQTQQEQGFYITGGVKAGIPFVGKYASQSARFNNRGYYPKYNNWATTQEFAGYGIFDDQRFDGKLKFDISLMFAFETGMKWRIGRSLSLYTGAYFDYGLNNAAKNRNLPFVVFSADDSSEFTANSVQTSLAKKVNIMAVGIKVRLSMKL